MYCTTQDYQQFESGFNRSFDSGIEASVGHYSYTTYCEALLHSEIQAGKKQENHDVFPRPAPGVEEVQLKYQITEFKILKHMISVSILKKKTASKIKMLYFKIPLN